ncbi:NAD(P)H-binding protein [Kitasatospora sp. NBC_01287]|uniref:NAD(P)-dependent oxidoreductase n=1 Tax=Kitasatospora sp. NBC_01287 TaxID=2903573 RepID=UPI0022521192|nr:NAD(P)H-binding protein [Kitasatospora sp. NBC_01287]MCX4745228.1 NAD(P)H-binding protein [Kitasatospora sp. NBC_01287]
MSRIVVFGAGGNAGRRAVARAVARGHQVTAVVRVPAEYPELTGPGVSVVAGDVTDPASVAAVSAGADAAISAAYRADVPSVEFFPAAARALLAGLARAGVPRLVAVGVGTVLEAEPGVPVHDTPGFPAEAREFSLGHAAELALLGAAGPELDWVVLAPPPAYLDAEGAGTGRYRTGGSSVLPASADAPLFAYADLAVALVDEVEAPAHHRALVAVGPA